MVQAKQQNVTRHKRNKSEVKKHTTTNASGMTASRSANQSVQTAQKKLGQKKMTIKTERQLNIDRRKSAEQATQPASWMTSATNANALATQQMKVDAEGLSLSSMSSAEKMMDSSMMTNGKNRLNVSI